MGYCDWYILNGHEPVRTTDLKALNDWMGDIENRRVAVTEGDGWRVSTVFLGLDHWMGMSQREGDHIPILFETMVFRADDFQGPLGSRLPEWQERYATWEEAEAGHEAMVARVREWVSTPERRVRVKKRATMTNEQTQELLQSIVADLTRVIVEAYQEFGARAALACLASTRREIDRLHAVEQNAFAYESSLSLLAALETIVREADEQGLTEVMVIAGGRQGSSRHEQTNQ